MPRPLSAEVLAITGGGANAVREHILAAAHRVIVRDGLAAASTRTIAEEAGLGSGTLYNYFGNRTELAAKAIVWRAATVAAPLAGLPARAGTGSVASNLLRFARQASLNLDEIIPLVAAAFSDPPLLVALRREMAADGLIEEIGGALLAYLLAERDLGRVAPRADCETAASIVFSLCHDRAFQRYMGGETEAAELPVRHIEFIAGALTSGAPTNTIKADDQGDES